MEVEVSLRRSFKSPVVEATPLVGQEANPSNCEASERLSNKPFCPFSSGSTLQGKVEGGLVASGVAGTGTT